MAGTMQVWQMLSFCTVSTTGYGFTYNTTRQTDRQTHHHHHTVKQASATSVSTAAQIPRHAMLEEEVIRPTHLLVGSHDHDGQLLGEVRPLLRIHAASLG